MWEAVALHPARPPTVAAVPPAGRARRRARLPRGAVAAGLSRPPAAGRRGVRRRRFGQDPGDRRVGPCGRGATGPSSAPPTPPTAPWAAPGSRPRSSASWARSSDAEVTARVRSLAGELDQSLQSIDPAGMHQEQLWALGRLLQEKGTDRPLLILIDDMHRSGDQMLKVLGELSGRLHDVPLLTVLAGRTDPGDWLAAFPAATTVRLGPLSRPDAVGLGGWVRRASNPLAPEACRLPRRTGRREPPVPPRAGVDGPAQGLLVDDGDRYRLGAHRRHPGHACRHCSRRGSTPSSPTRSWPSSTPRSWAGPPPTHLDALGRRTPPAALRSLVENGLMRHGSRRPLRHRRRPLARSRLRDAAAQRPGRPPPTGRHDRRASPRSGPGISIVPRVYLTDDPVRRRRGGRSAGPRRAGASSPGARHLDALRLLERAVALGCRRSSVLLDLAKVQTLCRRPEDVFETLAMVEDDPDDPAVAVERDHTEANAKAVHRPGVGRVPARGRDGPLARARE